MLKITWLKKRYEDAKSYQDNEILRWLIEEAIEEREKDIRELENLKSKIEYRMG